MRILFELSGENPTLSYAEIKACMDVHPLHFEERERNRIFVVDAEARDEDIEKIAKRLSLCHTLNEVIASGKKEEIIEELSHFTFAQKKFKIEGKKFEKEKSLSLLKKECGEILTKNTGAKADLHRPDVIFRIFIGNKIFFCRMIARIDRKSFEKRKPQHRPFSSPVSLHPKFARAIVNLSRIKKGERLLDPFCGTGGILIEAGLIGAKVMGIDIKKKMIDGCKKNLEYYGINNYSLCTMDMRNACSEKVDSIVSDFPYGRSTYTGDTLFYLYDDAFKKLKELLNNGRRAIIGLPHKDFIAIGKRYFELEEVHALRVHRSLTRYFCVYYLDTN